MSQRGKRPNRRAVEGVSPSRNCKKSCPTHPSAGWDICPADGGRLLSQKFPPFIAGTAGSRGIQGGTPWLIFFRPFFVQRQRKGIDRKPRARTQCRVSVPRRRQREIQQYLFRCHPCIKPPTLFYATSTNFLHFHLSKNVMAVAL